MSAANDLRAARERRCYFMRSRITWSLVGVAAMSVGALSYAWRTRPRPRIQLDTTAHDFGELAPGDVVEHTFLVKNSGSADLFIENVRSTCGCSQARLTKSQLSPNEVASLTVRLTVREDALNPTADVFLYTNDPSAPKTTVSVEARASPDFELSPPSIDFGTLQRGRSGDTVRHSTVLSGSPESLSVAVHDIYTPSPVHASLDRSGTERPRVVVSVAHDAPCGPITATLVCRFKGKAGQERVRETSVRGTIVGVLSAIPEGVTIGPIGAQWPCVSRVDLVSSTEKGSGTSLRVEVSARLSPYLSAEIRTEHGKQFVEFATTGAARDIVAAEGAAFVAAGADPSSRLVVPVRLFGVSSRAAGREGRGK